MSRMYTPREVAEIFGLSYPHVCKLARLSRKEGYPFPRKRGRNWEATLEEWHKVLHPEIEIRKPRKNIKEKIKTDAKKMNYLINEEYSANRASKLLGVNTSWLIVLARRSIEKGNGYPRIAKDRSYVATLEEWKKIIDDPTLRAWTWSRKNSKKIK